MLHLLHRILPGDPVLVVELGVIYLSAASVNLVAGLELVGDMINGVSPLLGEYPIEYSPHPCREKNGWLQNN